MGNFMETLPGQCQNSKREIEELIRQADAECKSRMGKAPSSKTTHNDSLQTRIQKLVDASFDRFSKQSGRRPGTPARPASGRRRLRDIDDATFIRGITQPITLELDDEGGGTGKRLADVDDATFIKSITNPTVMDLD